MRSLQVLTPHMECIYNCPFCISKTHEHDNTFINNYENDYMVWMNNLINVIIDNSDLLLSKLATIFLVVVYIIYLSPKH